MVAYAPIVCLPTLSEVENPAPNGIKEEMEVGAERADFYAVINCRDLTQVWLQFLRPTLSWLCGRSCKK